MSQENLAYRPVPVRPVNTCVIYIYDHQIKLACNIYTILSFLLIDHYCSAFYSDIQYTRTSFGSHTAGSGPAERIHCHNHLSHCVLV